MRGGIAAPRGWRVLILGAAFAGCSGAQAKGSTGGATGTAVGTAGTGSSSSTSGSSGGCSPSCASGEICIATTCYSESCAGTSCPAEQVCVQGTCTAASCVGVSCPSDEHCLAGACIANGPPPDGGANDGGGGGDGGSCSMNPQCTPGQTENLPCALCGNEQALCDGTCQWVPTGNCIDQTDVQTDVKNCGACGVVCPTLAAAPQCLAARCIVTLAIDQPSAGPIVVEDGGVYWTTVNAGVWGLSTAADAGTVVQSLGTGLETPLAIVATDRDVYVADPGRQAVYVAPRTGSGLQIISSGQEGLFGVAVQNGALFWGTVRNEGFFEDLFLYSEPVDGGAPGAIYTQVDLEGVSLGADAVNVYWGNNANQLLYVPVAGGGVTAVPGVQSTPIAIATSSAGAFWVDQGSGMVMGFMDGGVSTLASGLNDPSAIAVNGGDAVYWIERGPGEVKKLSLAADAGGVPEVIFSGGNPEAIAADETGIYWTDFGANTVMRATPR